MPLEEITPELAVALAKTETGLKARAFRKLAQLLRKEKEEDELFKEFQNNDDTSRVRIVKFAMVQYARTEKILSDGRPISYANNEDMRKTARKRFRQVVSCFKSIWGSDPDI